MQSKEEWEKRFRDTFRIKTFSKRIIKELEKGFKFPNNLLNIKQILQEEGKGIYLYSPAGTGKTVLAAMLLEQIRIQSYLLGNTLHMYFITVPELLANIRNTFSNQGHTEMEIINKYSLVDWLVLDDLGIEKTSDWSFQTLYLIINQRYEKLKPVIFTSNLSLEELAGQLGDDRLSSRIFSMCYIYHLKGQDKRVLPKNKIPIYNGTK